MCVTEPRKAALNLFRYLTHVTLSSWAQGPLLATGVEELALSAVEGTATAGRVLPSKRCFDCGRSLYAITPLRMTRGKTEARHFIDRLQRCDACSASLILECLQSCSSLAPEANPAPALNKGGSLRHYGRERGATWFIIGSVDRAFLFYEHA